MKGKRLTALMLAAMLGTALPVTAFGAWQEGNPLVAHALGEVDGKIETNSKEAFVSSWSNGYRALEVDLTYTSDGALVARHDFEKDGTYYRLEQSATNPLVMDSNTYRSSKIIYEQTPMTAADLMMMMSEYTDVYLITDTKETDQQTVERQFRDLKQIAENMNMPEIMDRIVPQVYHEDMYRWVKEIYPFQEWIYTLYLNGTPDYEEIAAFCAESGIGTVTIQKERVTKAVVDTLHAKGLKVYAHTVNRYKQMEELLALGVDGVYTDKIKPYELDWVGLKDSRKPAEKTVTLGGKELTLATLEILNEEYVPLRQLAVVGKGFQAVYHKEAKTMTLSTGKPFTGLGNELLMDQTDRLIMKKADFTLLLDGKDTGIRPVLVDGEVYVPFTKTTTTLALGYNP